MTFGPFLGAVGTRVVLSPISASHSIRPGSRSGGSAQEGCGRDEGVMVLLKTLQLPALTPEMLRFFSEHQVFTVEDFLCHDLQSLATHADRSLVTSAFNQAVRAVLSYLENFHEDWSLGSELLEDSGQFLPIGCASVDSLLNGGLQEGTVTELVGASSTGKSQMCMQAAASVAYALHSTVIYVDTCRTFSGQRVAEILESFLDRHETRVKDQEDSVGLVMKCIQRIGIFDVFSMLSFLRSLHGSLQSKRKIGGDVSHLRLLIIDSASSVVSPVLGATNSRGYAHPGTFLPDLTARSGNGMVLNYKLRDHLGHNGMVGTSNPVVHSGICTPERFVQDLLLVVGDRAEKKFWCMITDGTFCTGHSLMISLARCLNKLAISNRIAVLITNHTVTGEEGQIQAALGESWISVPHVRLWFARDSNNDICEVSLSKHTSMACGKQAAFYIDTSGLHSIDDFENPITPPSARH